MEDKALIFKKSDITDLQRKIQDACNCPEKVLAIKNESAKFICKKYNWDDVVDKTMKLYGGK